MTCTYGRMHRRWMHNLCASSLRQLKRFCQLCYGSSTPLEGDLSEATRLAPHRAHKHAEVFIMWCVYPVTTTRPLVIDPAVAFNRLKQSNPVGLRRDCLMFSYPRAMTNTLTTHNFADAATIGSSSVMVTVRVLSQDLVYCSSSVRHTNRSVISLSRCSRKLWAMGMLATAQYPKNKTKQRTPRGPMDFSQKKTGTKSTCS